MTSPSCRLSVICAREAPAAVILRRGPSRWYHVILWDTARDVFAEGAWFRGRIYEEKCDLSPDGRLFVYFAHKGKGIRVGEKIIDSWTAVSRPPYLHALVIWPQGMTYYGGGRFVGNRRLALRGVLGEPYPNLPAGLELVTDRTELKEWFAEPQGADWSNGVELHRSSDEVECADWSGRDHRDRVIFTVGGKVFRRRGREGILLADFTDRRPDPQPPPDWATRPL